MPSASSSRNCCVSIFSVMTGICRRSSAKRQVRCCNHQRISAFHLPPKTSTAASTSHGVQSLLFWVVPYFVVGTCPTNSKRLGCFRERFIQGVSQREGGMKVGVLGSGDVAKVLASGFLKHGHDVMVGTRTLSKLADWAKQNPKGNVGGFADA